MEEAVISGFASITYHDYVYAMYQTFDIVSSFCCGYARRNGWPLISALLNNMYYSNFMKYSLNTVTENNNCKYDSLYTCK